ncbi:hypothetical protein Gotri_025057 [Gossypium trilobum]|uniref:Uncharacterized protein n=1 Tax=Gossypium trilobum TaxID=34281 RepID=A0A7J9FIK5_9ROSI|nr:hypothetical protein [Gossypium trilobum]
MASEDPTKVSIKLLIDQESSKVIVAEAGSDIVDILRSLLKFPLGHIARLIGKHQCLQRAGCLNNLYNSVVNLSLTSFRTDACKSMLLNPRSIYEDEYSKKLKLYMDGLPGDLMNILLNLGINNVCQIEEKVVDISLNEFMLVAPNVKERTEKDSKTRVKIMLRKSDRKILCGEANEDFVDLLFSFLAIPLESALELLGGKGFTALVLLRACICSSSALSALLNLYVKQPKQEPQ